MQCPTCTTELTHRTLAGQEIDVCAACGGLWADAGELSPLIRDRTPHHDKPTEAPPLNFDPDCPRCDGQLAPFEYAHDSGVTLAKCQRCAGLWLNESQLDQLACYRAGTPAVHRLEAALADDHRRTARWQLAQSLLYSKWLSGLVAMAYLVAAVARTGELRSIVSALSYLVLPMACIWFSDGLGRITGVSGAPARPRITRETPGVMVAIGGWIVLLAPPVLWLLV